jgi:hypothetical protein
MGTSVSPWYQATALRDALTVLLLAVGLGVRHAPLIALLPGWLRLLQVLRRYRDDHKPAGAHTRFASWLNLRPFRTHRSRQSSI